MAETISIEPGLMRRLHRLAEETQRPEAEIIQEAISGYLAADRRYVEVLRERIAAADSGDFASEQEVSRFMAENGD